MSDTEKQSERKPFKVGDGTPGPGRKKGVPNKNSTLLKDMIIGALDKAGGVDYLYAQALENPGPFMTLVGKVLPMQITGADGGAIQVENKPDLSSLTDDQLRVLGSINLGHKG